MPTKAQLLELNKQLTKEKATLVKEKQLIQDDLDDAHALIKSRQESFNAMRKGSAKKSDTINSQNEQLEAQKLTIENLEQANAQIEADLKTSIALANKFKAKIPWWKSKK